MRRLGWKRWTLLVAGFLSGAGTHLVTLRPTGNPPAVRIEVPRGATPSQVVGLLGRAGLAPHPTITHWTLRVTGAAGRLQAGTYFIPGDANALEVADVLSGRGAPRLRQVALPRGASVWEIALRFERAGLGSQHEVLALASDHAFARRDLGLPVGPPRPPRGDGVPPTYLEGFLFPDTYPILPTTTAREMVREAALTFKAVWTEVQRDHPGAVARLKREHRLSETDLVTLASLVDEEIGRDDEAPRVAGVFYNRLARGMRLQTDPTLMYRPDRVARVPTPADRQRADNPYNTYAIPRLPPGPICSPSRVALAAVLAPEKHGYLFFVARGDGRHAFSRTYPEHQRLIREHLRIP